MRSDRASTAGVPGPPLGRPVPRVSRQCPLSPPTAALSATLHSPAVPSGLTRRALQLLSRSGGAATKRRRRGPSRSHRRPTSTRRARVRIVWYPRAWGASGGARGRGAHTEHGCHGISTKEGEKMDGEGGGRAHLRSVRRRPSPGRSSAAWLAHRTDYESAEQPRRALPVGETLRGEEGRNGRRYEGFLDADGCSACAV